MVQRYMDMYGHITLLGWPTTPKQKNHILTEQLSTKLFYSKHSILKISANKASTVECFISQGFVNK